MDLAFDGASETHIAIDVELTDQAVARAERDGAALAGGGRFGRRLIRR
jgi:hypothetical protein